MSYLLELCGIETESLRFYAKRASKFKAVFSQSGQSIFVWTALDPVENHTFDCLHHSIHQFISKVLLKLWQKCGKSFLILRFDRFSFAIRMDMSVLFKITGVIYFNPISTFSFFLPYLFFKDEPYILYLQLIWMICINLSDQFQKSIGKTSVNRRTQTHSRADCVWIHLAFVSCASSLLGEKF